MAASAEKSLEIIEQGIITAEIFRDCIFTLARDMGKNWGEKRKDYWWRQYHEHQIKYMHILLDICDPYLLMTYENDEIKRGFNRDLNEPGELIQEISKKIIEDDVYDSVMYEKQARFEQKTHVINAYARYFLDGHYFTLRIDSIKRLFKMYPTLPTYKSEVPIEETYKRERGCARVSYEVIDAVANLIKSGKYEIRGEIYSVL